MAIRVRGLAVVVIALALIVGGCAGKKKGTGPGGEGLTEEGLAVEGSLAKAQQGAPLPTGETGPLKDVRFAFDSSELDDQSRRILRDNADWLKDNSGARVEVEGHCDERGTVEYNLALGARRARAAKDYLVSLGADAGSMTTISYGEELPLCYEHTEACWAENRRVHFVILRD